MLTVHMMIKFNYKCMFEVVFVYLVAFMFVFHHNFSLVQYCPIRANITVLL